MTLADSAKYPGPPTKVFVYRGGEMSLNYMTDQKVSILASLREEMHCSWAIVSPFADALGAAVPSHCLDDIADAGSDDGPSSSSIYGL
eukprot:SAG31_NODE_24524_length_479_cov_1.360526_1_plen_88_part_00